MTGLIIDDDLLVVQTIDHFVEKSELVESCRHAEDAATAVNLLGEGGFTPSTGASTSTTTSPTPSSPNSRRRCS